MPEGATTASTAKQLMSAYDIQNYLSFDGGATFIRITEVRSLDPSRENNSYNTQYIERKTQVKYATGMQDTVAFEVYAVGPDGIQQHLAKYEDVQNVPVVYVRTLAYDFEKGAPAPASARVAKKAEGIMNQTPITAEYNNPGVFHGEVSISSEYEYGTFDESSLAFTAKAAG